jgi:RNA polymerase sigma factor (sigma-70 family)
MSAFLIFNLTLLSNFYRKIPQSLFEQFYKQFTYIPIRFYLHRHRKKLEYQPAVILMGIAAFFVLAFYSLLSIKFCFVQALNNPCFSPGCRSPPSPFICEPHFKMNGGKVMQHWLYRNFKKYENSDGSLTYTITVYGEKIEVSEEVYTAYAKGGYKMEHTELSIKCDRFLRDADGRAVRDEYGNTIKVPEREVSMEKLIDEERDTLPSFPSAEDVVFLSVDSEIKELYRCLSLLADDERELIRALFFEGKTEQQYAKMVGIKRQNVNKRKARILKKIKIFFEEGC